MKKYLIGGLLGIVGVLLLFAGSKTAPSPSIEVGAKGPTFTLKDVDGVEHSLDQFLKSKYTVLMFIATQCPVSNAYNERMAALYRDYSTKEIAIVGINSNKQESAEEVKEHAAQHGFKFPILKDWNNVVADAYGAQYTPEIYVLDGQGRLQYHGRIDDSKDPDHITTSDVRETLDALLAGKAVPRAETKAFGCSIKRVKKES